MTQTPSFVLSPSQAEISICGETMTILADQGVHARARSLIWEEFFRSRKRGVDWDTHLPWAVPGEAMSVSVIAPSFATGNEHLIATLLVRRLHGTNSAMTGFVCVAPSHRGLGLSRVMLDFTASMLAGLGLQEMLLWTGTPAVYEGSGFVVSDQEQRVTLRGGDAQDDHSLQLSTWPSEGAIPRPGLPPFAIETWQATLDEARIVFADTVQGPFLLDMHGESDAIMRAMFAARRGDWSAFVSRSSQPTFHTHVTACDCLVKSCPGPFTMRRQLGDIAALSVYVPPALRI